MPILEKTEFDEKDIPVLRRMLPEYLQTIDLKSQLYVWDVPKKLVSLGLGADDETVRLDVLELLELFLEEQQDLVNISRSSVLELCYALLGSDSLEQRTAAFELLQSLCEVPRNAKALSERPLVFEIARRGLEEISAGPTLNPPELQEAEAILSFLYIYYTVNEKEQPKLRRNDSVELVVKMINELLDCEEPLTVNLGLVELISEEKSGAETLLKCEIEAHLSSIFMRYLDKKASSEGVQIAANAVGTMVSVLQSAAPAFFENKIPALLFSIASGIGKEDDKLLVFIASAITELLHACKNQQGGVLAGLQKMGQIDDVLELISSLPQRFAETGADCYNIYGVMIETLATVPKNCDFVRTSIMQRGVIPALVQGLQTKNLPLQTKITLLQALAEVVKRQPIPAQIQITEIPACTAAVLKLKRELANIRGSGAADKGLRMHATDSAKLVLERLGHSEGRNVQKMQMYTMLAIGCVMLVVAGFRGVLRR